jgi:hypothetical protein
MKMNILDALKSAVTTVALAATTGCHSTPRVEPVSVSLPQSPHTASDGIWMPDQFSAYSVGRYVDPNDPAVMHDAHTLYRREESGWWNLAPANSQMTPGLAPSAGQHESLILRDALTAELNRQRATSLALIEQAKILDAHLKDFNVQSREFQDALKQFYSLRDRMTLVSNRLDSIEYQLRALPPAAKSP